jgi:ankyrin repeat protein
MPSPSQKGSPGKKASPSKTPSPEKPSPKKLTPKKPSNLRLYKAALEGDNTTVMEEIDLKADVDWTYETKFEPTPLIAAAKNGHADVVQSLISAGADLNKPNKALETPIFKAIKHGNLAIVNMLIKNGADINKADIMGFTPLHEAVLSEKSPMNNYIKIIQLLLDNGANINAKTNYGTTPLHVAAVSGNKEIVFLLLKNGADINITNNINKRASEMARDFNFPDIAEMIEKWPTLYAIAMLEQRGDYNKMDMNSIKHLYRFMGGKRTTRGKRILGRKTRSNRRRRE